MVVGHVVMLLDIRQQIIDDIADHRVAIIIAVVFRPGPIGKRHGMSVRHDDHHRIDLSRCDQIINDVVCAADFGPGGFVVTKTVAEHDDIFSAYQSRGVFRFSKAPVDTGDEAVAAPGGNPRAPMNGTIVALLASTGETVAADTPLLVMEAMKMEHTIRAPVAGSVTEFFYQSGDLVDGEAELLSFEPSGEAEA
jgi:biotin carboxyl carrier protein